MKHWSLTHDSCQNCGTTERPHRAIGLCSRCYYKQYTRKPRPNRAYQQAYSHGTQDGYDKAIQAVHAILKRHGGSCRLENDTITITIMEQRLTGPA